MTRTNSATARRCFFIGTSWFDGAVPEHFRALAAALVREGHQVVMLVDGRKIDAECEGNPAIYTWPSVRPVHVRDAVFLARLLRRHRPDCVLANFGSTKLLTVLGWLMNVPVRVAWYHTLSAQIDLDGLTPPWQMKVLRLRSRLAYGAATHLVPVSRAAGQDLQRVFGVSAEKMTVLFNSLADPVGRLNLSGLVRAPRKVVCAGRFFPVKGQDVLIRAVGMLARTFPDLTVEFVGAGPLKASCEELARDLGVTANCIFVGSVPHGQVLTRMAAATATVVPSRTDNLPTVVIESLAVGTPVVASKVGGIPEMFRNGVDGFLVPPNDPAALAGKLVLLLSNDDTVKTMGSSARACFFDRFEQEKVIREQARWLTELVSS